MKQLLYLCTAFCLLMAASCQDQTQPYRSGDLIFVEGSPSGAMDQAIMHSTGTMVHVGIVEVRGDSVFVIDATPKTGVSRRDLATFFEQQKDENGHLPNMKLMRLRAPYDVEAFVAKAKSHCGKPYDLSFLPDNDRYYCSELIYDCYQVEGKPLFEAEPMNFRNSQGEFDPYWVELFEAQGMAIPQDALGTNPEAMSHATCLKEIVF